jgi:hypothetical protein
MVGPGSSKKAIYAALFGNLGIAISKLIAALFTGSASMWAETYLSFSDTFNQVLLLVGIRTSENMLRKDTLLVRGKNSFLVFHRCYSYIWYFGHFVFGARIRFDFGERIS